MSPFPQVCEEGVDNDECSSSVDCSSISSRGSSFNDLHALYGDDVNENEDEGSVLAPYSVQIQKLEALLDSPENELGSLGRTSLVRSDDESSFSSEGSVKLLKELALAESEFCSFETPSRIQEQQQEHVPQLRPKPQHKLHQDRHVHEGSESDSSWYDETSVASPTECDISGTWDGEDCHVKKILSRANSVSVEKPIPRQVSFEGAVAKRTAPKKRSKVVLFFLFLAFLLFGVGLFLRGAKVYPQEHTRTALDSSASIDSLLDLNMKLSSHYHEEYDMEVTSSVNTTTSYDLEGDSTPTGDAVMRTGAASPRISEVDEEEVFSNPRCNHGNAWVCSTRGGLARQSQSPASTSSKWDNEEDQSPSKQCTHGNALVCSTRGGLVRPDSQSDQISKLVSGTKHFISKIFNGKGKGGIRLPQMGAFQEDEDLTSPVASPLKLMAMATT